MSVLPIAGFSTLTKRTRIRGVATVVVCSVLFGTACGSSGGSKSSSTTTPSTQTPSTQHKATSTPGSSAKKKVVHKRVGKVTAVGTSTITVTTKRIGAWQLHTTSATSIERAVAGSTADIKAGHQVLIPSVGEVIVLPQSSTSGRLIVNVANGSFSITKVNGKGVTKIASSKVKVETASPAKLSDIKTGSEVLALVHRVSKGVFDAVEVILLPAGSALAK
jgi:hypothetical protein